MFTLAALAAAVLACGQEEGGGRRVAPPVFAVDPGQPLDVADGRAVGGFTSVAWAGLLANGAIAVLDDRVSELSFFPAGAPPFIAGHEGDGPGEFRHAQDAGIGRGDSVFVVASGRMSVFTDAGVFARSVPIPFAGEYQTLVGMFGDSVVVLSSWGLGYSFEKFGLRMDSATFFTIDAERGALRDTFRLPERHSYYQSASTRQYLWTFPPFFGRSVAGVLDSTIVWGMGDDSTLYLLAADGRRLDSLHVSMPAMPLDRAEIEAAETERLNRPRNDAWVRRNWRRMFDDLDFPERHPFFDRLVVGAGGLLWLRSPGRTPEDSIRWWGEARTGRAMKVVVVPPDLDIVQFMDSTVVAIRKNENDVQTVLVLRLVPVGP